MPATTTTTTSADLTQLPNQVLAQHAAEQIDNYHQGWAYAPEACFELLRRALAEQSAEALAFVFQHYEHQVISWVYRHPQFAQTGESAEFFANAAFESFYFALRGTRFSGFSSVPAVLSYLKRCVHTAIAKYRRDERFATTCGLTEQDDVVLAPDLAARVEAHELWSYISTLLPSKTDQLLAQCVLGQGLKPREVSALYQHHWHSQRDVSVDLYRIRRTLRADPELLARACSASVDTGRVRQAAV